MEEKKYVARPMKRPYNECEKSERPTKRTPMELVYPDPVRVGSIGRKVEDLLADPENDKWLSISAELCGGTHLSNTREAKVFALLSEEGIAKGIHRVQGKTFEDFKKKILNQIDFLM
ncbi:Alanine--tRNA ligase [Camellia lanceoleosa]|uniref:Alanine--tRNA ligase n=1 Tax=Camellia lanceoleosa TaxID=1840588 RepID=A0ACC0GJ66_9ERIC|nr:Alanine--tRNA ligase [Camellia lanceoleosa]